MTLKLGKLVKIVLLSLFITQVLLVYFAVFGDVQELPGFKFIKTVFILIVGGVAGFKIDFPKWLYKQSFSVLMLLIALGAVLILMCVEEIAFMIQQLRVGLGRKICGKECYVQEN